MKSLLVVSFLLLLVSIGTRAGVTCEQVEMNYDDSRVVHYTACENDTFYNFRVEDQDMPENGKYECEKQSRRQVVCLYEECEKSERLFGGLSCNEDLRKSFAFKY